jgi:dolichol-phosphate mannosyltransferase
MRGDPPAPTLGPALTVIVPLFDEADGVASLAEELGRFLSAEGRRRPVDFVLVDDGSRDETHAALARHFAALPATVLRHPQNRGLTAALATGVSAARGDLVAWLDGDLTYDPSVLSALAAAVDDGADLALASCHHPDGRVLGVPQWRVLLSRAASRGYRALTRRPIHTFTGMVRVYRRDLLLACAPRRDGFLGVTEVLLRAIRRGAKIAEVPAVLRSRRTGRSKMRALRVAMRHLSLMAGYARGRV